MHSGFKPYRCDEHSIEFHTKKGLRDHVDRQHKLSHKRKNAFNPCNECNKMFVKKYGSCLERKKVKIYVCNECKKLFVNKNDNCLQHQKAQILQCGECKKMFSKKYDICSKHTMICEKGCGYITSWKRQLKMHSLSSRCDPQKPFLREFICLFCKKGFSTEKNKRKHERVHKDGKPHECNHCFTQFTLRHALIKHLRRKHNLSMVWDTKRREYC